MKNLKISFKNTKGGRKTDITNIVKTALQERIVPELNSIKDVRIELRAEIAKTNTRIDRLYEVIVRRDEHHKLEQRVADLERDVSELKRRLAA